MADRSDHVAEMVRAGEQRRMMADRSPASELCQERPQALNLACRTVHRMPDPSRSCEVPREAPAQVAGRESSSRN